MLHFSDRQCSIAYVDFLTAYKYVKKINERIKKMESKEIEEKNKGLTVEKSSLLTATQIGGEMEFMA